MAVNRL
jgi:hypothetical protein